MDLFGFVRLESEIARSTSGDAVQNNTFVKIAALFSVFGLDNSV